jgi:hypothetical protein
MNQNYDNTSSTQERQDEVVRLLARQHFTPPPNFTEGVMRVLVEKQRRGWSQWCEELWESHWRWFAPTLAGATAILFVLGMFHQRRVRAISDAPPVVFQLYAPTARQIELVGSFTDWQRGRLFLQGPDVAGRWRLNVKLSSGLHEYLFLVDGQEWIPDPDAAAYRPDGFGRYNALIEVDKREREI